MATKNVENQFIRFILALEDDRKLLLEFLSQRRAKDLYEFFQKKGFEIPVGDCKDILKLERPKGMRTLGEIVIYDADRSKGY